jgi:hypothetical protein
VQRQEASGAAADLTDPSVKDALSHARGGKPLPKALVEERQGELGIDLPRVRIHTDEVADRAAQALSARAFTVGEDIYFSHGAYSPDGPLLVHELTHVRQHQQGRIGPTAGLTVSSPSDTLEREAHAATSLTDLGRASPTRNTPAAPPSMGGLIFRSDTLIDVGQPGEIRNYGQPVPLMSNHLQQTKEPVTPLVPLPSGTKVTVKSHIHIGGNLRAKVVSYEVTLEKEIEGHKSGFIIEIKNVQVPGSGSAMSAPSRAPTTPKPATKSTAASTTPKAVRPEKDSEWEVTDPAAGIVVGNSKKNLVPPSRVRVVNPIYDERDKTWILVEVMSTSPTSGATPKTTGPIAHYFLAKRVAPAPASSSSTTTVADASKAADLATLYRKYHDVTTTATQRLRNAARMPYPVEVEPDTQANNELIGLLKAAGYDDVIEPKSRGRLAPMSAKFEANIDAIKKSFETVTVDRGNKALDKYNELLESQARYYHEGTGSYILAEALSALKADYDVARAPTRPGGVGDPSPEGEPRSPLPEQMVTTSDERQEAQARLDAGTAALAQTHPLLKNPDFNLEEVMGKDAAGVESAMQSYIEQRKKDVANSRELLKKARVDLSPQYSPRYLEEGRRDHRGLGGGSHRRGPHRREGKAREGA